MFKAWQCTDVFVDLCVHIDYDFLEQCGHSTEVVRSTVLNVVNQLQILYNNFPRDRRFPYNIHIELGKMFVEESITSDPIKLRTSTLTQAVIEAVSLGITILGEVYMEITKAHDLLTAWLSQHRQPDCDHYTLITGTKPAQYRVEGDEVLVYSTDSVGLSWNKRLCCGSSGKYSSVVFHAGSETSFVLAHELAHNIGVKHDTRYIHCRNMRGFLMDPYPRNKEDWTAAGWSPCSIQVMRYRMSSWISMKPECMLLSHTKLTEQCREKVNIRSVYDSDSLEGGISAVCHNMVCRDTGTGTLYTVNASAGTPCGQYEKCDGQGNCVRSTDCSL